MSTPHPSTISLALQKYIVEVHKRREATHEENILNLMAPTTTWFGLFTKQRTRDQALKEYIGSLEYNFVQIRGGYWLSESQALLTHLRLGGNPLDRISNGLLNILRSEGLL